MSRVARRPGFWLPFCLLALSPAAAASTPERSGLTGDLSIGPSVTIRTVSSVSGGINAPLIEESSLRLEPGLAPLGISIGAYFTPHIALLQVRLPAPPRRRFDTRLVLARTGGASVRVP